MRTIKLLALAATAATIDLLTSCTNKASRITHRAAQLCIVHCALCIALLTSCNNDDNIAPNTGSFPADGIIRVATNVANSPFQKSNGNGTRAGLTTSTDLKYFNLKIKNQNPDPTVADKYSYCAIMQKDDNGVWGSYELGKDYTLIDLPMLWQNSTQTVEVTAVCWSNGVLSKDEFNNPTPYYVSNDQSTDDGIQVSDYLYMPATTITPNRTGQGGLTADGKLLINFVHIMSKVNLTLTLGTEFNAAPGTATNPIIGLTVNGTKQAVYFNASTGAMTDNNDPVDNPAISIIPWIDTTPGGYTPGTIATTGTAATSAVAKYEVILAPQTVAAGTFTVTFAIDGKEYAWKSTEPFTFAQGTEYTLALTAGKDIVTASDMTANPWQPGDTGGDGSLETE